MTWSTHVRLRLHLAMQIDEDTTSVIHRLTTTITMVFSLETYTHRSLLMIGPKTDPQGPRRPRFSFFQSSQCQRTDPYPIAERDVRDNHLLAGLPGSGGYPFI